MLHAICHEKINQEQSEGTFLTPKSLLLRDYLTDWLESYAKVNVRGSTYEDYVRIVHKYILPALGNCDIKKLSPVQIDKFYAHLMEHGRLDGTGGLSAKTVLYTHRVLNEALAHAVKRNLLVRNPANNLTNIPKPKKFKPTIYTLENVMELMEAVKDTFYEVPVALAALCGLRRGECLELKASDVDFDRNLIHIRRQAVEIGKKIQFTAPKSDESVRTISAPTVVFEILKKRILHNQRNKELLQSEYHDFDLIVCYNNGNPIRPRNFTWRFTNMLKNKGFKRIRFHDLRHSCASLMLKSGVAMKTASEILGHSSIAITADLYTHVLEDMKFQAAEQIDKMITETKKSDAAT